MLPLRSYFRTGTLGEGGFGSVMTVYDEDGVEFAAKRFDTDEGDLEQGTCREIGILRLLTARRGIPEP